MAENQTILIAECNEPVPMIAIVVGIETESCQIIEYYQIYMKILLE